MRNKILFAVALILVIIAVLFIIHTLNLMVPRYQAAEPANVNTAPMRIYGLIEPAHREVFIAPPLLKRIKAILVHESASIAKDQPLVLLDDEVEKARLETSKANVAAAKAAAAISKDKWRRNLPLYQKQVVNEFDFVQSELQAKSDEEQVQKAIREMELAQVELERLVLRSPVDGKVYHIDIHLGAAFAPESRNFIVGEKELWVHLSVESFWINRLADVEYNVFHADTQEFLGTGRLVRVGSYMGPGYFEIDDPKVMVELKYKDAYLVLNPVRENLPIRLVVYAEPKASNP